MLFGSSPVQGAIIFGTWIDPVLWTAPAPTQFRRSGRNQKTGFIKYSASKEDRDACALKEKCCPKNSPRRITVMAAIAAWAEMLDFAPHSHTLSAQQNGKAIL